MTSTVTLSLDCHEAPRTGSAQINGVLNVCPVVDGISANPGEVLVGSSIALTGSAHEPTSRRGETLPARGLERAAAAGSAPYFESCNRRGQLDAQSLHAGRPVTRGEKWVVTKWMRERRFVAR